MVTLRSCEYCGHRVTVPCDSYEGFSQCPNVYPNEQSRWATEVADKFKVALSPEHYSRWKIQPITFIMENKLGYAEGNVVKYVCRHDAKNGLEDIEKAIKYLKFIAKWDYGVEL